MQPKFSQVARNTPFDDTDSILNDLTTQEALDDALWMHRNYLPIRDRDYFVPTGYQYKAFQSFTLDHTMTIDGTGVVI